MTDSDQDSNATGSPRKKWRLHIHLVWLALGLSLSIVVGHSFQPLSPVPLVVAGTAWLLGTILPDLAAARTGRSGSRLVSALCAAPMALLLLNGLLDLRDPIEVPSVVQDLHSYESRSLHQGRTGGMSMSTLNTSFAEVVPESGNDFESLSFGADRWTRIGSPVLVQLGRGAFGLTWVKGADFHPPKRRQVP